jgi:CBS domain-containing protein
MSATGPHDTATVARAAMTVEQLMRPPTTTVEPSAHLAAAAYLMKRNGGGALIVTTDDERHRPVAMLTDADITQAVADGRNLEDTRITQVVSGDPLTVEVDTGVREAAQLMLARGVHYLPVVRQGHLAGVVGISDVCRALL